MMDEWLKNHTKFSSDYPFNLYSESRIIMIEPGYVIKNLDIEDFVIAKVTTKTIIYKLFTPEFYDARCIVKRGKRRPSLRNANFIITDPRAERIFLNIPDYYFGECDISLRHLYDPKRSKNEGCILPYAKFDKYHTQRRISVYSEYLKDSPYLIADDPMMILENMTLDELNSKYLHIVLRKADSEPIKRKDNLMGTLLFFTDSVTYEQNLNTLKEIYSI